MKYASLGGILSKYDDFNMSIVGYLASFTKLVHWYLSELIIPDGIVLMWATPIIHHDQWIWLLIGGLLIGACLWFIRRSGRSVESLALIWFIIGFLPVLAACLFRPSVGLIIEPHWMLLSSIGFFIFCGCVVKRLLQWKKWSGLILWGMILNGLIMMSHLYNTIWADEKTYCHYWLEKVPEFKTTKFFLASAFMNDQQYDQARPLFLEAREGVYSDWQIYGNLGVMDFAQRNYPQATEHYQKALSFNPSSSEVYNNLALVYERTGNIDDAIKANNKALELNKFLIEPRLNLGRIALSKKEFQTAIQFYKENLNIIPYEIRTYQALVGALVDAGQQEQAHQMIEDLRRHCKDKNLLMAVAQVAADKKMYAGALDLYMQVLRLDPGYKLVYVQAGVLLANLNELDRAVSLWEQAKTIDPTDQQLLGLIKQAKHSQK